MLKVKEEIKLEELEKYGFQKPVNHNFSRWNNNNFLLLRGYPTFIINMKSKEIDVDYQIEQIDMDDLDFLYDMIQDGIIEKVVQK